ncbi:Mov34/MPN/PAD-1 family protein [Paenibacillus sp. IHBB 10380]|uniref:Mov34/MPN/PAD-1 family protein n=1 Tax=Paenibacillus sp. IHBB 10380 TaxID=1566358 RepID=UPI0006980A46|nr:Mov34/MPN/PAD-1 family protein [Paenibacillus sp. IHBB 10380]
MTVLLGQHGEIVLNPLSAEKLTKHTFLHLPQESCGVLLGTIVAGNIQIEQFIPIRNVAPNPLHSFMFSPDEWVPHALMAKKLVGIVHSHPHSDPTPSSEDLDRLHLYAGLLKVYLICTPHPITSSLIIHAYHILRNVDNGNTRYTLHQAPLTMTQVGI